MNEPKIVFEDKDILIIDKPAGWITNDAATVGSQPTVQAWVRRNFKFPISNDKLRRSGIVHRIDKETSGILVAAKTKEAFEDLQRQFKSREVEKSYTALVHGKVEPEEASGPGGPMARWGEIKAAVGRLPWRRDRFGILPGGREATTRYRVIRYYDIKDDTFSLLELNPKTGRTHQIRIHLKYIGHPIVGDTFYAGRKTSRKDRIWCPRLFLHAAKIKFFHPRDKKSVEFESKLAPDLDATLHTLSTSLN